MGLFGRKKEARKIIEQREIERKEEFQKMEELLKNNPLDIMKQLIEENSDPDFFINANGTANSDLAYLPLTKKYQEAGIWHYLLENALDYKKTGETFGNGQRFIQSLACIHNAIASIDLYPDTSPRDDELSKLWHSAGLVVHIVSHNYYHSEQISAIFFQKAIVAFEQWQSFYELGICARTAAKIRISVYASNSWELDNKWDEDTIEFDEFILTNLNKAIRYFDKAIGMIDFNSVGFDYDNYGTTISNNWSSPFNLCVEKIDALCDLRKFKEAIVYCDEVIEIILKTSKLWETKGEFLYENWKLGKDDEARMYIDKSNERKKNIVLFYQCKSQALFKLKKYEECIIFLTKCIELDFDVEWAWSRMGSCLKKLGRKKEAEKCFENSDNLTK